MLMVGGPVGTGAGDGAAIEGKGDGAAGGDEAPPEHAATAADTIRKRKKRNTARVPAGGASGAITVSRLAKRRNGVDGGSPSCRNEARQQRNHAQHHRYRNECQRIECPDPVNESG